MKTNPKRSAALALLQSRGIRASEAASPLHRLLWACGIDVPPPHFCGFWFNASLMGCFFGLAWGITMWLLQWRHDPLPLFWALAVIALLGITFGLAMAGIYRRDVLAGHIPSWQEIGE
jgi:hypothetical protein